jgi:hypothetical protein
MIQQGEAMRLRVIQRVQLHHWVFVGLVLTALSCGRVGLAAPSGLPEALQACTQEHDDSRRLACYDREMAHLKAASEKSFGLSGAQERKLEPPSTPEAREKPKPQVLSSTVAAVSMRGDGRQVIRLDNGETWVQGEAYETFHVNAGDIVTIKHGALGSFYMYVPSGLATRVTRVR